MCGSLLSWVRQNKKQPIADLGYDILPDILADFLADLKPKESRAFILSD